MPLLKLACAIATCILAAPFAPREVARHPQLEIERVVATAGGELLLARSALDFPVTVSIELEEAENARAQWEGDGLGVVVPPRGVALLGRVAPLRGSAPYRYRWREQWWAGARDATPDPESAYRSPLAIPARVVQGFHGEPSHRGADAYAVDLQCPLGTAVHAARSGLVVELREDSDRGGADPALRDEANFVRLLHADGTLGFYAHFARNGVEVELGQRVTAGAALGRTGSSGWMGEPHLHFAVALADARHGWRSIPFRFERVGAPPAEPREGELLRGALGSAR
ncbi:MAG: M23 family metallopeptidase [Planctomycetes bacterium]|nr:M23 family metallopeptidase [Planctomycetota bacterium]